MKKIKITSPFLVDKRNEEKKIDLGKHFSFIKYIVLVKKKGKSFMGRTYSNNLVFDLEDINAIIFYNNVMNIICNHEESKNSAMYHINLPNITKEKIQNIASFLLPTTKIIDRLCEKYTAKEFDKNEKEYL